MSEKGSKGREGEWEGKVKARGKNRGRMSLNETATREGDEQR